MRAFLAFLLSLPLSVMLMGLLAAAVPAPWQSWLVLQLLGVTLLWMLLVVLVVPAVVVVAMPAAVVLPER